MGNINKRNTIKIQKMKINLEHEKKLFHHGVKMS